MALKMKLEIKLQDHSSPSSAPHTNGSSGGFFLPTSGSEDHRDSPKNLWRSSLSLCPALALPLRASSTQDLRTAWRLGAL